MTSILKKAELLLQHLRQTIDNIESRHSATGYNFTDLRDEIATVTSGLRKAEYGTEMMATVQDHGAKIHSIKLGELIIKDVTKPGYPSVWAVCDENDHRLSKSGVMDAEPEGIRENQDWTIASKWDEAHQWWTAKEALQAAADYLAKKGGAK